MIYERKIMMRKILGILILSTLLTATLAGCGMVNTNETSKNNSQTSQAAVNNSGALTKELLEEERQQRPTEDYVKNMKFEVLDIQTVKYDHVGPSLKNKKDNDVTRVIIYVKDGLRILNRPTSFYVGQKYGLPIEKYSVTGTKDVLVVTYFEGLAITSPNEITEFKVRTQDEDGKLVVYATKFNNTSKLAKIYTGERVLIHTIHKLADNHYIFAVKSQSYSRTEKGDNKYVSTKPGYHSNTTYQVYEWGKSTKSIIDNDFKVINVDTMSEEGVAKYLQASKTYQSAITSFGELDYPHEKNLYLRKIAIAGYLSFEEGQDEQLYKEFMNLVNLKKCTLQFTDNGKAYSFKDSELVFLKD